MALSDLSDPRAVKAAIAEFDTLGRKTFLERYGFGRARSYFVGGIYDSKAIAGAAYSHQYPDRPALKAADFSGGEASVVAKLRSLGFEVTAEGGRSSWAFCANPKFYDIRAAVAHLDVDSWTVRDSKVRAGDYVVIWQTLDSEGNRGIVGLATVLNDPEVRKDDENPYWIGPGAEDVERRVRVRYLPTANLPIWIDDPKHGALLQGLSVAKARGGTVFKISPAQWRQIKQIASHAQPSIDDDTAINHLRYRSSGQGFGLTGEERRVVEQHAMELARRCLERDWESVVDVSAKSSYDFHCKRATETLRVEVKGTTSLGEEIILTKNEVRESNQGKYALFVVSEIELNREKAISAKGGICRLFIPWSPKPENLLPIAYKCRLDHSSGVLVDGPSRDTRIGDNLL